jgi:hypothetical protein
MTLSPSMLTNPNAAMTALQNRVAALERAFDQLCQSVQVTPYGLLIQTDGDLFIQAGKRISLSATSDLTIEGKASCTMSVRRDYSLTVFAGNTTIKYGGQFYDLTVAGSISVKATATYYVAAGLSYTAVAGTDASLGGNRVALSGRSAVLSNPAPTLGNL